MGRSTISVKTLAITRSIPEAIGLRPGERSLS